MDHQASSLSDYSPRFKRDKAGRLLARVVMNMPAATQTAIETAALRAGRTWDEQLDYLMSMCLGDRLPDRQDPKTREDWMALVRSIEFQNDPLDGEA